MKNTNKIALLFEQQGGTFYSSPDEIATTLKSIKVFIFDWDGVFHSGKKGNSTTDVFSEPDSMGFNMLRYGFWRKNNRLAQSIIITGQNNHAAVKLANREHFNAVYLEFLNKTDALIHVCHNFNVTPSEIAYVYDDVNDLGLAKSCALRIQVKRKASPLLSHYIKTNKLADYLTANNGDNNGVREVSELLLGLNGNFDDTITSRVKFDSTYQTYFNSRNAIETKFYKNLGNTVTKIEIN